MRNFQDTFETRKRSLTSAFSICMTVPLKVKLGQTINRLRYDNYFKLKTFFTKFSENSVKKMDVFQDL